MITLEKMTYKARANCLGCLFVLWVLFFAAACAPTARVDEGDAEADEPVETPVAETMPEEVVPSAEAGEAGIDPARAAPSEPESQVVEKPTLPPRFDPENPDWPLRYQELYDAYLDRFTAPALGSEVEVLMEGGRSLKGLLLELTDEEILLATASGDIRIGGDMMQPKSQAHFFADRHAHLFARHHARQEYEAWRTAQMGEEAPARPTNEVTVRPRNTQGVDVDPLHAPRRVRRNAEPPVNEEPTGRVWQVEEYILRRAGSPESLKVHYWGRVQPHGDGFTVRVRYSLQGAAGFGLSNEDMIFFMYGDGTVYQRAAYRGK